MNATATHEIMTRNIAIHLGQAKLIIRFSSWVYNELGAGGHVLILFYTMNIINYAMNNIKYAQFDQYALQSWRPLPVKCG